MKKLNNKGMTTTELLITFTIVASVVLALYVSITNLRSQEIIASYKESITTYKDLLTREIQNDLIMKKLTSATVSGNIIIFKFSDNVNKKLEVKTIADGKNANSTACKLSNATGNVNDEIIYNGESHPLPSLGTSAITTNSACKKVNNLRIKMENTKLESDGKTVTIKIGLSHPDLGDKYSINIVAPINYTR